MPCEGCSAQFTVFRRKKICTECRRFYCNQCLTKRTSTLVCERCLIFTKRPLSKNDLLKLKPKDLISYLQSKHISTAGCLEKEELVNLVLTNASDSDNNESISSQHSSPNKSSSAETNSNPFDNIKQSCQSLFNSFTDKISSDFNLDGRQNKDDQPSGGTGRSRCSISEQPRIRQMPSYTRYQQEKTLENSTNCSGTVPELPIGTCIDVTATNNTCTSASSNSTISSSPAISLNSISSQNHSSQASWPPVRRSQFQGSNNSDHKHIKTSNGENYAHCGCSDDEIPAFQENKSVEKHSQLTSTNIKCPDHLPGPSGYIASNRDATSPKAINCQASSGSSFEELGAIGGTTSDNIHDSDAWQIVLEKTGEVSDDHVSVNNQDSRHSSRESKDLITKPSNALVPAQASSHNFLTNLHLRPVSRRRSDGFIYNRNLSDGGIPISRLEISHEADESDGGQPSTANLPAKCCSKCGESKRNIRKHIARFKGQLESSQLSETEIKRELKELLLYLENRVKSLDYSDTDSNHEAEVEVSDEAFAAAALQAELESVYREIHTMGYEFFGDDDGIHVYPHNEEEIQTNRTRFESRFLNLLEFNSSEEFDELSVKQLKEILMLHRVDYRGCCEKHELLERVNRLWKNLQTSPATASLPTDDLCKVCMDAPIECVILECGHMATCTSCGKVLSECPICRQYIVRVVRFFRA